jgi:hypothetical protein
MTNSKGSLKMAECIEIKGFKLYKDNIEKLLSDNNHFLLVKNDFTRKFHNQYTEFNVDNSRHNYYVRRLNGELIMVRSLVDLSLFDTGSDDYGLGWHSDDYNEALFKLDIPVFYRKQTKTQVKSRMYLDAIDNDLFIIQNA